MFVEYCPHGDLKNWLKNHSERYVKVTNDSKSSMFNELRKRLGANRPVTANFRFTKNLDESLNNNGEFDPDKLSFNDSDLNFFGYQIAKGKK